MSMIILPERLRAAGIGNQVPPVQNPKWTPFFQSTDPRIVIGVGFNGYYSKDISRNSFGGLSEADSIEKAGAYLTEDAYVNYLKTLHPWVNVSSPDGAANGTYALDYAGYATTVNGSSYGGYEGYVFFQKHVYFNGINPAGAWDMTLQVYLYYRLVNPT